MAIKKLSPVMKTVLNGMQSGKLYSLDNVSRRTITSLAERYEIVYMDAGFLKDAANMLYSENAPVEQRVTIDDAAKVLANYGGEGYILNDDGYDDLIKEVKYQACVRGSKEISERHLKEKEYSITIEQLQKDFEAGIIVSEKRDGYSYFSCKISGARWAVVKLAGGSKKIVYEVLGGNAWSYAELDAALKALAKSEGEKAFKSGMDETDVDSFYDYNKTPVLFDSWLEGFKLAKKRC